MNNRGIWIIGLLSLAILTMPAIASGQQPEQDVDKAWNQSASLYEKLYARGIQDFAEGRYGRAVDSLQRAYARGGSATTLKLIIRAYDAMGHCDAAARQRAFFSDAHPDQRPPGPRRCSNPVEVTLVCQPVGTPVRIDRVMSSACGQKISMPAGEHLFATVNQRTYVMHAVEQGQDALVLDSGGSAGERGYADSRGVEQERSGRGRAGGSGGSSRRIESSPGVELVESSGRDVSARLICSGSSFGPSEDCISVKDDEVADVSGLESPLLYIESPRNSENYVPTICYDGKRDPRSREGRECVTVEKGSDTKTCCSVDRVE